MFCFHSSVASHKQEISAGADVGPIATLRVLMQNPIVDRLSVPGVYEEKRFKQIVSCLLL